MPTRLAELHTEALDLADPEAFANEAVHIHVAHSHLPASSPALVQRPRRPRRKRASALALTRLRRHGNDGRLRALSGNCSWTHSTVHSSGRTRGTEMDRLHRHCLIMQQPRFRALPTGRAPRNTGAVDGTRPCVESEDYLGFLGRADEPNPRPFPPTIPKPRTSSTRIDAALSLAAPAYRGRVASSKNSW